MTNTLTADAAATVEQVRRLEAAGADIVRVSCPDEASTEALRQIVAQVSVPIVADIHFHYKRAIEAAQAGDRSAERRVGESVEVRLVLGGPCIIKKKKTKTSKNII